MQFSPINIFKFLEKKDNRPIPFKVKLIHELPLTADELNVSGSLSLADTKITSLPAGLHVGGSLYLAGTEISKNYTKSEVLLMIKNSNGKVRNIIM